MILLRYWLVISFATYADLRRQATLYCPPLRWRFLSFAFLLMLTTSVAADTPDAAA